MQSSTIVLKLIQKICTLPNDIQNRIYGYLEFISNVYTLCDSSLLFHIINYYPDIYKLKTNSEVETISSWHIYHRRRKKKRAMTI
jgi:hypothetical protein